MAKTNRWAIVCPTCKQRYYWTGPLEPVPPCMNCKKANPSPIDRDEGDDVAEALALLDEITELADEVPDAGQDFAQDVLEKAESICRTIERANSVTNGQMIALENIRAGLARWIRD